MKHYWIVAATWSGVIAAHPAQAQATADDGPYVAVAATLSLLNDADQSIFNVQMPGARLDVTNPMKTGFGGQIALGYAFRRLRVEAEVGITRNKSDRYVVTDGPFAGTLPQDGKARSVRYMANAYFDFLGGRVRPYVGAGVGAAKIDVRTFAPRAPFPTEAPRELIDDSDTRFAYQLMGGLAYSISDRISLTGQYRWFDAGKIEGRDTRGERFVREHAGHNIDVGIRFTF